MNKNVELKVGGLTCDNTKCDYVDMSILRKDYLDYINFPCPKCGDSLLTEEDYNNVLILEKAVNLTNNFSSEEIEEMTKDLSDEDCKAMEEYIVNLHKGVKIIKK